MSQKAIYVIISEHYNNNAVPSELVVKLHGVALDFERMHEMAKEVLGKSLRHRAYVYEYTYDARLHCIGCMGKDNALFTALNWGRDAHPAHWSALLKGMAAAYSSTHTPFGIVADRLPGDVDASTIGDEEMVGELRCGADGYLCGKTECPNCPPVNDGAA